MKKSLFEDHLDKYEDWFEKNDLAYKSELSALRDQLFKGGYGIEVGIGSGRFADPLGIKIGVEPFSAIANLEKKGGICGHKCKKKKKDNENFYWHFSRCSFGKFNGVLW